MKAIINATLYDYKTFQPCSYILFDTQIREVGLMKDFRGTNMPVIDAGGKLLMPGLINFHTHVYSSLIRGLDMGATPETFQEVLESVWWRFDSALTLEDLHTSGLYYGRTSIQSGVTALIDHSASGVIKGSVGALRNAISKTLGIKALYCFETSDRFDIEESIEENLGAIQEGDGLFGLHAGLSLSDATLDKVAKVLEGTPIHIHLGESREDQVLSMERYKHRLVERFAQKKLLSKDSLLAHCVHIDDEEAQMIKDHQCRVVLNPTSNMNNAVGLFNYERFKKHDIDLLVGTDGLGANIAKEWQQLYYLGKQSMDAPSGIGLDEIKGYIESSYDYFNRLSKSKLGLLEEGYSADFILVDYEAPTPMTADNAFAHVFYGVLDNLRPESVYIDGEARLEGYKFTEAWEMPETQVNDLWERVRRL